MNPLVRELRARRAANSHAVVTAAGLLGVLDAIVALDRDVIDMAALRKAIKPHADEARAALRAAGVDLNET